MSTHNQIVPADPEQSAFTCLYCSAFSEQKRFKIGFYLGSTSHGEMGFKSTQCANCKQMTIWSNGLLIYPKQVSAPMPHLDMPEHIKEIFNEARLIANDSPRACAALLRLCIEKLCIELGGKGKNLNDDIAILVKNGLSPKIQQALDTVRVVGNSYVHPGQIDIQDDSAIVSHLFSLVNLIVEVEISQPKYVSEVFHSIVPQDKREKIEKRDAPKS